VYLGGYGLARPRFPRPPATGILGPGPASGRSRSRAGAHRVAVADNRGAGVVRRQPRRTVRASSTSDRAVAAASGGARKVRRRGPVDHSHSGADAMGVGRRAARVPPVTCSNQTVGAILERTASRPGTLYYGAGSTPRPSSQHQFRNDAGQRSWIEVRVLQARDDDSKTFAPMIEFSSPRHRGWALNNTKISRRRPQAHNPMLEQRLRRRGRWTVVAKMGRTQPADRGGLFSRPVIAATATKLCKLDEYARSVSRRADEAAPRGIAADRQPVVEGPLPDPGTHLKPVPPWPRLRGQASGRAAERSVRRLLRRHRPRDVDGRPAGSGTCCCPIRGGLPADRPGVPRRRPEGGYMDGRAGPTTSSDYPDRPYAAYPEPIRRSS